MKNSKTFFWIVLFGQLCPYLYSLFAVLIWGAPLYLHDPKELMGSTLHMYFAQIAVISILLVWVYVAYWLFLLIRKKIKLKSWMTLFVFILALVFFSRYFSEDLWYLDFWFFD